MLSTIFCISPVSTTTPEQLFSTIKRNKLYLTNSTKVVNMLDIIIYFNVKIII